MLNLESFHLLFPKEKRILILEFQTLLSKKMHQTDIEQSTVFNFFLLKAQTSILKAVH